MDRFQERFAARLAAELDAMEVRVPAAGLPYRPMPALGLIRPLAVATVVMLALIALASAVTRSADPAVWITPGVWMRAIGVAPASPSPATTNEPADSVSPSDRAEPSSRPEATETATPREPAQESPDRTQSDGSSGSPGEGPDG